MGASLRCAVDPEQPALLDSAHRALVNQEVYYFGSSEALQAFVREPWKFTGRVTDPVSLERFVPTEQSTRRSFGGRLFFFQSAATAATFDTNPSTYGVPRSTMHAKK